MENDSIRPSGNDTLVDIWVNGKLRAISVTKDAIDGLLGVNRAEGMSEDERCDFIRGHLPLVVTAVKTRLRETDPDADEVTIDVGQLSGRVVERRRGERRKKNLPRESLPYGERRLGDRRKSDRRRTPKGSDTPG